MFDANALAKVLAQVGAMGAIVSLLVEQVRGLFPVKAERRLRFLVLVVSVAFVYIYRLDALVAVGLKNPQPFWGLLLTALLVAGTAKLTNDKMNQIERAGDK